MGLSPGMHSLAQHGTVNAAEDIDMSSGGSPTKGAEEPVSLGANAVDGNLVALGKKLINAALDVVGDKPAHTLPPGMKP